VGRDGAGSGVDPEAFGGIGPVRVIGSCPFLCLLVRLGRGESIGSICWISLLLVRMLTLLATLCNVDLVILWAFSSSSSWSSTKERRLV
jgi:hypothetical protein